MTERITTQRLDQLYRDEWHSLVHTATWLVGSSATAEEVVQDAFIRLVEHWPTLRDRTAAPAWLRKTVVNLSRMRLRRSALGRRKQEQAAVDADRRFGSLDESASRLGDGLEDGALGAAIRDLPRRQRECVVLRFVHDLTVPDVAAALGISAGAAKSHLHRALRALESTTVELHDMHED